MLLVHQVDPDGSLDLPAQSAGARRAERDDDRLDACLDAFANAPREMIGVIVMHHDDPDPVVV